MRRATLLPAVLALGVAACVPTRTQLVVVVSSDVPREDMDGYRILVFGEGDLEPPFAEGRAVTVRAEPIRDEPPFTLPASFGVGPREGDAERRVRVLLQGTLTTAIVDPGNPYGEIGLETTAVIGFVEHEHRRLDMTLSAACIGMVCDPGQTCGADGCQAEEIDVRTLPRWQGTP